MGICATPGPGTLWREGRLHGRTPSRVAMLTLDLPAHVDEARARLLLAIALFQEDDLTVGRAAEVAGLSYRAFVDALAARGIPAFTLTFDESDLDFLRRQAEAVQT